MELRKNPLESPITTALVLFSGALTVAWWTGTDVSRLTMTADAVGPEPWRLFTSALLHVNLVHLLFNAYWTWTFGSVLEARLGPLRFGGLVLALAAGSSAAELALAGHGVGLSGVGYGLFGFLWAARAAGSELAEAALPKRVVQLFVGWFFFCIVATWLEWMNVANVAHGAGAVLGGLAGALFRSKHRVAAGVGFALCFVASIAGAGPLREHVNLTGEAARDIGRRADAALDAGKPADAAPLYERALTHAPNDARLWYNLHVAYHRLERYEEAADAAQRAATLEPSNDTYTSGLGDAFAMAGYEKSRSGDLEGAVAWYEKACAHPSANPGHHLALSSLLRRLERTEEARAVLNDARQKWPDDPSITATLQALPPP